MKRFVFILALAGIIPFTALAQDDDMYFTPKKEVKQAQTVARSQDPTPYYIGSDRDVDEYNRRGKFNSSYQIIGKDSLGNDIIEYQGDDYLFPDSSYVGRIDSKNNRNRSWYDDEEYYYSRRFSRFYDPWFFGYYGYYYPYSRFGWYDPWYAGYWGGYYTGWYSPWYYPYYGYGWGYPYYSYGWGYPYYGYGYYGWSYPVVVYNRRQPVDVASRRGYVREFGNGTFGGSRSTTTRTTRSSQRSYSYSNDDRFGGVRSSGSTPTRTYTPSNSNSGSFGGGSFGGSRSVGGSSFGGSRSVGGGSVGGGSGSNGGRFGGRR